jgi:putative ABC transport system permease protein
VVRTGGDPNRLVPSIRARIHALDPNVPATRVAALAELRAATAARTRFALLLFEVFAAVAVVLSAIGVFGVLAGAVTERRREIGLRAALGAKRSAIVALVLREGLTPALAGTALGVAGSLLLGRFLEGLLYEVSRLDLATYGGVMAILLAVALAACWVPARRAARLDPALALRTE